MEDASFGPCSILYVCPLSSVLDARRKMGLAKFHLQNLEGQASSETSALQREWAAYAKPFLIWYLTEASH